MLLLAPAQAGPAGAASAKYACPYNDRLCALKARYLYAGAAIGDWVSALPLDVGEGIQGRCTALLGGSLSGYRWEDREQSSTHLPCAAVGSTAIVSALIGG